MYFPIYIKEITSNNYCAGSFDLEDCEVCDQSINQAMQGLKDRIRQRLVNRLIQEKQSSLITKPLTYYQKTELPLLQQQSNGRVLTTVLDVKLDKLD